MHHDQKQNKKVGIIIPFGLYSTREQINKNILFEKYLELNKNEFFQLKLTSIIIIKLQELNKNIQH